jgi:ParB/RepB/Spo0J family partition protein
MSKHTEAGGPKEHSMKKTEETFTSIPVGKIISESNRKHGGMGNIEILAESIKTEGLINPPTVTLIDDGTYRVIAGRRRVEAVRQLKWKEIPVRVINGADADRLESIGLAENVNRQEMSPLDEAETFKKLLDKGTSVEDIAAYYDRTVAGIHHRVRLCDLIDGVKEMFREGKIKLSGVALVAGLPPDNQEKFLKKFGNKNSVDKWEISNFFQSSGKLSLACIADEKCGKCKNRTYNTTPGLFEDYYLHDACFDAECYRRRWEEVILNLIVESGGEGAAEQKIILDRDIPKFLPPKTASVNLDRDEYTLLSRDSYTWKETEKKAKKDTAWLVSIEDGKVTASRVSYKKHKRPVYGSYSSAPADPVKEYLIDQIGDKGGGPEGGG